MGGASIHCDLEGCEGDGDVILYLFPSGEHYLRIRAQVLQVDDVKSGSLPLLRVAFIGLCGDDEAKLSSLLVGRPV